MDCGSMRRACAVPIAATVSVLAKVGAAGVAQHSIFPDTLPVAFACVRVPREL